MTEDVIGNRIQSRKAIAVEKAKIKLEEANVAANKLLDVAAEQARVLISEAASRAKDLLALAVTQAQELMAREQEAAQALIELAVQEDAEDELEMAQNQNGER